MRRAAACPEAFDDEGAIPSGNEGEEEPEAPVTREDMHELRKRFGNNRRTASYFYKKRNIQLEMRVIYMGARLLAKEFGDTVKLFQEGQAARHVPGIAFEEV